VWWICALGGYKLNILKSDDGNEKSVQRFTFDYSAASGRRGTLYQHLQVQRHADSQFCGEPLHVAVDEEDPDKYAAKLWKALNEDNKVSLFVRAIDLATQTYKDVIINKYKTVEG
jgi:IMP cyclohydrolase